MKKLSLFGLLGIFALLFSTSCTEDPNPNPNTVPPSTSLINEPGFVTTSETVAAGATFYVKLEALAGSSDLASVGVYEDDVLISAENRITINGGSAGIGNPITLNSSEASGFTWELGIVAHDTEEEKTYRFTVNTVDPVNGGTSSRYVTINTIPVVTTDFELTLRADSGCVSDDVVDVPASSAIKVCPMATRGAAGALSSISVYENDVLISDLTRLRFGTNATIEDDFTANPQALGTENAAALDTVLYINVQNSGTSTYRIVVEDETGATVEQSFDVSILVVPTGTPIDFSSTGTLYNSDGPTGTGGLDLDTGNGTGSSDASAEIRDLGGVAVWKMEIAPITANGVNLRSTSSVDFASIQYKEDIVDIYNTGVGITESVVAVGNVYAVERSGVYYLIEVVAVNDVAADNSDNIVFNIKK